MFQKHNPVAVYSSFFSTYVFLFRERLLLTVRPLVYVCWILEVAAIITYQQDTAAECTQQTPYVK